MYEPATIHLRGVQGTIMCNGRLADPMDPWAKKIKEITSMPAKRRTDEDLLRKYEYEFMGGLYLEDEKEGKTPGWPGENIEALLVTAAKSKREGPKVKRGVMVPKFSPLIYDGPKDRRGLWEDPDFRLVKAVKLNGKRVMRCRPIFREWELKVELVYLPDQIDFKGLVSHLEYAGQFVGLGDWQGRYGLFEVAKVEEGGAHGNAEAA